MVPLVAYTEISQDVDAFRHSFQPDDAARARVGRNASSASAPAAYSNPGQVLGFGFDVQQMLTQQRKFWDDLLPCRSEERAGQDDPPGPRRGRLLVRERLTALIMAIVGVHPA